MLQNIHEKVHGWFAWFIIIVIAVTFALFGASYYIGTHRASNVKATVGHTQITNHDFQDAYQRNKQNQPVTSMEAEKQLKEETMRQLITNYLRIDGATSEGFVVSKEQAQQAMLSIPQFLEDGAFSKERFQQVLSANLYTPETFLTQIQQGMLLNQQRFLVAASNFALPSELDSFIALTQQQRSYQYFLLDSKHFAKSLTIDDKDIAAYYDAHHQDFMTDEKVSLLYVELSVPAIIKSIKVTDEQLKNYYHDNQASYVTPAQYKVKHIFIEDKNQAKLEKVVKALDEKKDFTKLAKEYSDDLLAQNGDLPWMGVGVLGSDVDKAMVNLKVGDVSQAIKTPKGYEIIKLIEIKPLKQKPFAAVKEQIKRAIVTEKAQQIFQSKSDDLTDLSYQNPDSLEVVSKELKLPIKTLGYVTKEGEKEGLLSNKSVLQAAFSQELIQQGENSQPIAIGDDKVVVIRAKSHLEPTLKPMADVKSTIKELLVAHKASEKASYVGERLVGQLKAGKSITAELKDLGTSLTQVKDIKRDSEKANHRINNIAFTLEGPEKNQRRIVGKYIPELNAYAVVELTQVSPGKVSALSADERANMMKQLEASFGLRDYDIYLRSIKLHTEVDVKPA